MSVEAQKETMEFQAEVSQVLNLVIRSLYSNKEIFLRELISNASDASEKLRFEGLTDSALFEDDADTRIRISFDSEAGTLTISDNGIGMSRQEVTETIGTIASSGTKKFLEKMGSEQTKDSELIGQFGVGFYSAFIVADKVSLTTRRAGLTHDNGVCWESSGDGSYTIENVEKTSRGTDIVLHLREDDKEFAEGYRIRSIISKFSDHISIPVEMLEDIMPPMPDPENEDKEVEEPKAPEWEKVNKGTALWMRNKSDLSDEEYNEFYKHISHDYQDPLMHIHNRVEGNHEYSSLLYVPSKAPYDMWDRESKHGVKLYVRRVFIMDEAEKLMPHYLRFVKGVIDSDDLPLNVSREILQHDKKIDSIRTANTKRILTELTKLAKKDAEAYQTFWDEFGNVLKEGPAEDAANKEKIGGLLRFTSSNSDADTKTVSFDAYIENMIEGQDKIYYITSDTYAAAKSSPHLEVFKTKGIEVLLMTDRVDEWLVSHMMDYKGKTLQSITKGELDFGDLDDAETKEKQEKTEEDSKSMIERIKGALTNDVEDVRVSHRLTDSPACLVVGDQDMSANLQRVLKQMGQDAPDTKPILEVNPTHPLVEKMDQEPDDDLFVDLAKILLDQATLAEGGNLADPAAFVQRLNKLMLMK